MYNQDVLFRFLATTLFLVFISFGTVYAFEGVDEELFAMLEEYSSQKALVSELEESCSTEDCSDNLAYLDAAKEIVQIRLKAFLHYYSGIESRIVDDPRLSEEDQTTIVAGTQFLRLRIDAYEQDAAGQETIEGLRSLDEVLSGDLEASLGFLRLITSRLIVEDSTVLISRTRGTIEKTRKHLVAAEEAGNNVSLATKHFTNAEDSMKVAEAFYFRANRDLVSITQSFRMIDSARDVQFQLQEANKAHTEVLESLENTNKVLERLYQQRPWKIQ